MTLLTLAELHSRGFIWADDRHLAGQHPQKSHGGGGGSGQAVSYDRNVQGFVVAHLPDGTSDTFMVSGSGLNAATVRHPTDLPKPLYHGSNSELLPGEQIEPGHPGNFVRRMTHVYLTEDPEGADAESPKGARGYGSHVYEVRPTGWYGHRRDARGQDWATSDPVIVVREVPRPQDKRHLTGQHPQKSHGGGGGYVKGTDKSDSVDYEELAANPIMSADGDQMLGAIQHMQGFDGPPTVLTPRQFTAQKGKGFTLYRGVANSDDDGSGQSAERYAEQFRTGKLYPSYGMFSNGTYTTPDKGYAKTYTDEYGGGGMLKMALRRDAKVIGLKELRKGVSPGNVTGELTDMPYSETGAIQADYVKKHGARATVLNDAGRLAALKGYDAIWNDDPESSMGPALMNEMIILNRTAVYVEAARS
jgi:Rifampin ADP-ribosyl transferase